MAEELNDRAGEIQEVATRLFARHGFDGVSVRDICSALGVNCSTISYYFGGKKGLYLKVLRSQFAAYEAVLDRIALEAATPAEAILALCRNVKEIHARCPHLSAISSREGCSPSPEFAQALTEHEARYQGGHLLGLVKAGQKDGSLRPNLEPIYISRIVSMMLNSQVIARSLSHILHPNFNFQDGDYFDTISLVLIGGIFTKNGPEEQSALRPIGKQSGRHTQKGR